MLLAQGGGAGWAGLGLSSMLLNGLGLSSMLLNAQIQPRKYFKCCLHDIALDLSFDAAGQEHLVARTDGFRVLVGGAGKGLEITSQVLQLYDFINQPVL